MRRLIKAAVERTIVASGAARRRRNALAGHALVLAYHNIAGDGERPVGDRSLHLAAREFARQLDTLADIVDVVSLADVLARPFATGRPRVAITFDDAYEGATKAGVDAVTSRNMPATICVAPGLFDTRTWWDLLADDHIGAVPLAAREHCLRVLGGRRADILAWAAGQGLRIGAEASLPRIASEVDVLAAARRPGIALVSHSWSHANLAAISAESLAAELRDTKRWLADRAGITDAVLSYPYGLYSPDVERAAGAAGYAHGLRVDGGWLPPARLPFSVPRFNVPAGISLDGFVLRVSGMFIQTNT